MTRRIRITIGALVLRGTLEEACAPATCAAFVKILPLRGDLLHARWSGEAAWVPLGNLDTGLGLENATGHPRPGQVLLYPAGASETEILLPYGTVAFAAKCGPLSGNHFLTIDDEKELTEVGRRVLWDGAQTVLFELEADGP